MSDASTEATSSVSPANGVTTRTIPGMNCQGCVKRMREAVQNGDPSADVIWRKQPQTEQLSNQIPRHPLRLKRLQVPLPKAKVKSSVWRLAG